MTRPRLARLAPLIPALLGIGMAAGLFLRDYPAQRAIGDREAERQALDSLTRVERALGTLSVGLAALDRDVRLGGAPVLAPALADDLRRDIPGLRTVLVIDPSGTVRADLRPDAPAVGISVSDRAYFHVHADGTARQTYLGAPVESRIDGAATLPISRAVRDAGGSLLAVAVASVEATFFDLPADDRAGRVVALLPDTDTWIALDTSDFAPGIGTLPPPATLPATGAQSDIGLVATIPGEPMLAIAPMPSWGAILAVARDRADARLAALSAALPLPALIVLAGTALSAGLWSAYGRRRTQQQYAETLERLAERLRVATEGVNVGIWDWNHTTGEILWSDTLKTLLGMPGDTFGGTADAFLACVAPEDRARVREALDNHVTRGQPYDLDIRMIRGDGRLIDVSVQGNTVRATDGTPLRMVGTARDITARRSIETRLLEAEQVAQLGHWSVALPDGTLTWSPQTFRIYGLEPADTAPDIETALDHFLPEDRAETETLLQRCIASAAPAEIDARILRADGQIRFVRVTIKVQRDANGATQRLYGIIRDRTDTVRTRRELEQAQRFEAFGQLAGGVAHDFNNLLAVMLGNLELLRDDPGTRLSQESRDHLAEATRSIVRGRDLTQSLLSFARTAPLHPEATAPAEVLDSLRELLQRTLPASIQLEVACEDVDWSIFVDRSALEACLLNLAVNARDAMNGQGHLTISARQRHVTDTAGTATVTAGPYIALSVSDTGCGIDPAHHDLVFEPFFTTKPVGQGSGLGLSRVKGFAEQSGGAVRIDSKPGVGTTVEVLLPAAARGTAGDPVDETDVLAVADGVAGPRVLLVEDVGAVRRVLARQLEALGLTVTVAVSGDEAAGLIEGGAAFDLLVTDIVMPGTLQGDGVARLARSVRPDIPVIYLTGYAGEALLEAGTLQAASACLSKPVKIADLSRTVRQALQDAAGPGLSTCAETG